MQQILLEQVGVDSRWLSERGRLRTSHWHLVTLAVRLFLAAAPLCCDMLPDPAAAPYVHLVLAGFATGALFRSARGLRASAVAGAVGAVAATLLVGARGSLSKGL